MILRNGIRNVIELPHAKSLELNDDFKITSYQFSPGATARSQSRPKVSLLNANDAKFMGLPLGQILNNHKPFDFAFRSHSSANDRICYQSTDEGEAKAREEDPMLYAHPSSISWRR